MDAREQKIEELLTRGVAEVIDREHLKARLLSGEILRVKLGIDPTSPNIHLGRSIPLLKLRDFQDLGHQVVFIVGDFTAQIGDTSDKESERPMLSEKQVKINMEHYLAQAGKILDGDRVEVHYNSEWLNTLSFQKVSMLADAFSLAEFAARENIKKRLATGKRVSLRETLYPLMQGYDSVMVKADVELGGTDQRFNLLAGRTLQAANDQAPQDILMTNLIAGTDGRKMSSSWGNTINLTDGPNDTFGKVMSIPDYLIIPYFVHTTRVPLAEIRQFEEAIKRGDNPRDVKLRLGKEIVTLYHGPDAAEAAEQYFIETFSRGKLPETLPTVTVEKGKSLVEAMVQAGVVESKSDARRKIEQGGVEVNGKKIDHWTFLLEEEHDQAVVKVGKKDFFRVLF